MIPSTKTRAAAVAAIQNLSSPEATGKSDFVCQVSSATESDIVLSIRGVVGDEWEENDHATVVEALQKSPKAGVTIYVNSMGGSVFEGFGITNALLAHEGHVTAIIEGVAYSAASFLVLAADKVIAHKASAYGIHRSMVMTMGNQIDHAAAIQQLDAIDNILIDMYVAKTGLKEEAIVAMLDATLDGTMLTAKKAVALGFVDEIFTAKDDDDDAEEVDPSSDDEADEEDEAAKALLQSKLQAHKATQRKRAAISARVKRREIVRRLRGDK